MNNVSTRRKTLLLLILAVFVTTPWASAARLQGESPRWEQALDDIPFLGNFWGFLWSMWDKAGCHIDPDGRCVSESGQSSALQPKEGCGIDPLGHCVNEPTQPPPLQPKAGCNIDPWGHCIP